MTSELRLEAWLPISACASMIRQLRVGDARRAAQARPMAPAPMISRSTGCIRSAGLGLDLQDDLQCAVQTWRRLPVQRLSGFTGQTAGLRVEAPGHPTTLGDLADAKV